MPIYVRMIGHWYGNATFFCTCYSVRTKKNRPPDFYFVFVYTADSYGRPTWMGVIPFVTLREAYHFIEQPCIPHSLDRRHFFRHTKTKGKSPEVAVSKGYLHLKRRVRYRGSKIERRQREIMLVGALFKMMDSYIERLFHRQ